MQRTTLAFFAQVPTQTRIGTSALLYTIDPSPKWQRQI